MSTCHHALSVRCGSVCANAFARLDSHTNQSSTLGRPLGGAAIAHRLRTSKYGGARLEDRSSRVVPRPVRPSRTTTMASHSRRLPWTHARPRKSMTAMPPCLHNTSVLSSERSRTYLHTPTHTRAKARILARGVRAHARALMPMAWHGMAAMGRRSVWWFRASLRVRADRSSAYSGTLERAQPCRATGCTEDRQLVQPRRTESQVIRADPRAHSAAEAAPRTVSGTALARARECCALASRSSRAIRDLALGRN